MEGFVSSVQNVDDCNPPVFIILGKLKLLTIVASVRRKAQFLDILDGDCKIYGTLTSPLERARATY